MFKVGMPAGKTDVTSKENSGNDGSCRDWEESYEVILWLGRTENYEDITSIWHIVYLVYKLLYWPRRWRWVARFIS
jgi:hypothetical protein